MKATGESNTKKIRNTQHASTRRFAWPLSTTRKSFLLFSLEDCEASQGYILCLRKLPTI